MKILAIDPGPLESAMVVLSISDGLSKYSDDNVKIIAKEKWLNYKLKNFLYKNKDKFEYVVIERVKSYGTAVGDSVFDTCIWVGRFMEVFNGTDRAHDILLVPRLDIRVHHCHSTRSKDSTVRQALMDRFGEPGTKKNPGFTYGIKKDIWSAFAIAIYTFDTKIKSPELYNDS